MDTCHLLLGTPWQDDQETLHDGKENMYSFVFDNVKIRLLPKPEVEQRPSTGDTKTLLAKREFVEEMLDLGIVYVLLGKESSQSEVVPESVRGLLEEFADIFPKELPEELPLLRHPTPNQFGTGV
jgi:hypothetical protein